MRGPLFIVGSGRSGTTILYNSLKKTLHWPGHSEGHVFPILSDLDAQAQRYLLKHRMKAHNENHFLTHVDAPALSQHLARLARNVYCDQYNTDQFIDKTPGPGGVEAIPLMQQAFPTMRTIFAKRRGIEVVRSSVKKFKDTDFETHCHIWATCMRNWRVARAALYTPYLEIEQRDIALHPVTTAANLGELLNFSEEEIATLGDYFKNDRPQSSGDLNRGAVSLENSGWSSEQIDTFQRICGPLMVEYGYVVDESYAIDPNVPSMDQVDLGSFLVS